MSEGLHLVRMVMDRRALARLAVRHRLSRAVDEGYLLHAGLAQLFATSSEPAEVPLLTFAVDDIYAAQQARPDLVFVLGYANEPDGALIGRMGAFRQDVLKTCVSRPVPTFEAGVERGFRTRVCPIVRTKIEGDRPLRIGHNGRSRSREVDAFVHAVAQTARETTLSREVIYADWLRKQEHVAGACALSAVALTEFQRVRMPRKGGEKAIERPDAVLEGTLTVTDPAAFGELLRRGVGRHRAFGFGMLLLRPPGKG